MRVSASQSSEKVLSTNLSSSTLESFVDFIAKCFARLIMFNYKVRNIWLLINCTGKYFPIISLSIIKVVPWLGVPTKTILCKA